MIRPPLPQMILLACCLLLGACQSTAPAAKSATPATAAAIIAPTSLKVDMEGGKSVTLSFAEIAAMPHEKVRVTEHDGGQAEYSGVPLGKILAAADVPLGQNLRGKNLALYIVVEGADGYKVTYSIVEADPAFGERHILLADQREGQPLADRAKPLQLIVPEDKMQARWVRMVAAIHVRRAG